jgi:exodeoxyribonuclease VII small subunit
MEMTEETLSFEQALEKLEQIVSRIEQGKIPLEKSIDEYARGIALIKQCRRILNAAEQKIHLLTKDEIGLPEAPGESDARQ